MDNSACFRRLKTWAGGKLTRYVHRRSRSQESTLSLEHGTKRANQGMRNALPRGWRPAFSAQPQCAGHLGALNESTRQDLLPFPDGWRHTEIPSHSRRRSREHSRHRRSSSEPLQQPNQDADRSVEERLNNMAKALETLARTIGAMQSQNTALLRQQQRNLEERISASREQLEGMARQDDAYIKLNRVLFRLCLLLLTMTVGVVLELYRSRCLTLSPNVRTALGLSIGVLKGAFFMILGNLFNPAFASVQQAFLSFFSHISKFVR